MKGATAAILCMMQLVMLVASQSVPSLNMTMSPRIDTHCHYTPPFYYDLLNSRNLTQRTWEGFPLGRWNASAHLAFNALLGTVTSVVSVSVPGAKLSVNAPVEEGRILARQLNEYGRNLTMEYPKKFLFFATLTLPDVEGAVAEAIYSLDALDAAGVILFASTFGEVLGTPRYAPLYKVLDDRNTTVFIHPSSSPCPQVSPGSSDAGLPPQVVDFLLDTSRAAMNLVYRNVTRDFPNIKFLLAHSGGFLPFAAVRGASILTTMETHQPSSGADFLKELTKFYVDLAVSANQFALPSTTAFFNTTQITFGTDFPFATFLTTEINSMGLQNFRLRKGARERINYKNAYALFKKLLK